MYIRSLKLRLVWTPRLTTLIFAILYFAVATSYDVTISTVNPQIVGQSLTLECSMTTVRGITSRVDIVWSRNGSQVKKYEGVNATLTSSNFVMYKAYYNIEQLSTIDDGDTLHCEVVIGVSPPVLSNNYTVLDVTGKYSVCCKHQCFVYIMYNIVYLKIISLK